MATYTVNVGDNLRSIVNSAAANDTFIIKSGVHRLQSCQPKNGQTFIGEAGAVLNGTKLLTSWTSDSGRWYTTGQNQDFGNNPDSNYSTYGNQAWTIRTEMLFRNNVPLVRVTALNQLNANNWYFDYAADRIYIGWNPSGHTIETSGDCGWGNGSGQWAFQSNNSSDVTIRNITIEKYATHVKLGAIRTFGNRWLIEDCTVRLNMGIGIALGYSQNTGHTVRRCLITDNIQLGLSGGGTNWLGEYNEISWNNRNNWTNVYWEAGGTKWAQTDGLKLLNNYCHHNTGRGLWLDYGCKNFLYEYNLILENTDDGIFHEINVGSGIIRNNYLYRNGRRGANSGSGQRSNIWIGTSNAINPDAGEIYGNYCVVWSNANGSNFGGGICISDQNRADNPSTKARNWYVHDNTVVFEGRGINGIIKYASEPSNDVFTTNRFDNNTYYVTSSSHANFAWNVQDTDGTYKTFSAFQAMDAVRADPNSQLIVGLPASYDLIPEWSFTTGLTLAEQTTEAGTHPVPTSAVHRHKKPPVGMRLNRSHPIAKELLFFVAPGMSTRHDFITGTQGLLLPSNEFAVSPRGEVLRSFDSFNGGMYWEFPSTLEQIGTEYTVLVYADIEGLAQYGSLISIAHNAFNWTTPFAGLKLARWFDQTTAEFAYQNSGTKYAVISDSGFIATGEGPTLYAAVRRGDTVTFYRGGQQLGAAKTYSADLAPQFPNRQPLSVMARSSTDIGYEGAAGLLYIAGIWNRALLPQELGELASDPYTMLRPIYRHTILAINPTSYATQVAYGEPELLNVAALSPDGHAAGAATYGEPVIEEAPFVASRYILHRIRSHGFRKPDGGGRFQANHPLADGLVWYVAPGGTLRHNFVTPTEQATLITNGSFVTINTERGPALSSSSTGSGGGGGAYWPHTPALLQMSNQYTVAVLAQADNIETNGGKLLSIPHSSSWANPFTALALARQTSSSTVRLEWTDSTGTYAQATSDSGMINVGSDGLTLYLAVRDGDTVYFYRNGVQFGAAKTASSTNDIQAFTNARPISLLHRSSNSNGSEGVTGHVVMAGIWSRALSADEVAELYRDPFAVIRPMRTIMIPPIDVYPDSHTAGGAYGEPTLVAGGVDIYPDEHASQSEYEDVTLTAGGVSIDITDSGEATATYGEPLIEFLIDLDGHESLGAYGEPTLLGVYTVSIDSADAEATAEYGSPTVVPGEIVFSPTGYASGAAEYGEPTLVAGDVTVFPNGRSVTITYGTVQLNPDGSVVEPDEGQATAAYGGPTLQGGVVTISVDSTDAEAAASYGAVSLVPGAITFSPDGIEVEAAYGEPTLVGTYTLSPGGAEAAAEYGSPTLVAEAVTISPEGRSVDAAYGQPTLVGIYTISPNGHAAAAAYAPVGVYSKIPGTVKVRSSHATVTVTMTPVEID